MVQTLIDSLNSQMVKTSIYNYSILFFARNYLMLGWVLLDFSQAFSEPQPDWWEPSMLGALQGAQREIKVQQIWPPSKIQCIYTTVDNF